MPYIAQFILCGLCLFFVSIIPVSHQTLVLWFPKLELQNAKHRTNVWCETGISSNSELIQVEQGCYLQIVGMIVTTNEIQIDPLSLAFLFFVDPYNED